MEKRRVRRTKKVSGKSKAPSPLDGNGVIVLKNLTKAFGDHLVLNNVSLNIEKGKTTVIIRQRL